ncbi:hypothetical protein L484_001417 [Morus notabilis]|uniref:Uncharacterized protein n=1 Tax=Morus notabilis TaxID=981085 RepID=W9QW39_9ROSA|nr:hypothetical protein L484_001417 [Morus notabilis]
MDVRPIMEVVKGAAFGILQKALLVMLKDSKALRVYEECNRDGPDYFDYYTCQVVELLSEDENSLPLTLQPPKLPRREFGEAKGDSLFSNAINIMLSNFQRERLNFQRERLKALLQQSAIVLTAESDNVFTFNYVTE